MLENPIMNAANRQIPRVSPLYKSLISGTFRNSYAHRTQYNVARIYNYHAGGYCYVNRHGLEVFYLAERSAWSVQNRKRHVFFQKSVC